MKVSINLSRCSFFFTSKERMRWNQAMICSFDKTGCFACSACKEMVSFFFSFSSSSRRDFVLSVKMPFSMAFMMFFSFRCVSANSTFIARIAGLSFLVSATTASAILPSVVSSFKRSRISSITISSIHFLPTAFLSHPMCRLALLHL